MPPLHFSERTKIISNVLGFQCVWWLCVLCGSVGANGWAMAGVLLFVALHLSFIESWSDSPPILTIALAGALFDQFMYRHYYITFFGHNAGEGFIPIWMLGLWLAFACTLNVSLKWLQGRWWLAGLLGAIFGPLSYLAAEKLHAVVLTQGNTTLLYIGIGWALLLPWLLRMRQHWAVTPDKSNNTP